MGHQLVKWTSQEQFHLEGCKKKTRLNTHVGIGTDEAARPTMTTKNYNNSTIRIESDIRRLLAKKIA